MLHRPQLQPARRAAATPGQRAVAVARRADLARCRAIMPPGVLGAFSFLSFFA